MIEHGSSRKPWYTRLHNQIFLAMVAGLALGATFGEPAASGLGWLGTVFIQALKMVIVPLVLASLTSGVASIGTGRELGRLGAKTIGYYSISSLLAIMVGLTLANVIQPGVGANIDFAGAERADLPEIARPTGVWATILRLILDFIPENPIKAMTEEGRMLGVIGFAILLGVSIAHLPEVTRASARRAADLAFEVMMKLTGGVVRLAPVGVLGLMTQAAAGTSGETFRAFAYYIVTVGLGLLVHLFVILPLLLKLLGGIHPRIHFRNMLDALVTAFSTSSSGATLPVTLRCMREKVGVSNRVTSFVIPMGATVNMDGTALYECAGVLFIAQVLGFPLDISQQLVIVVTAFAASIGTAAVPSAGLVMIFICLDAIGLEGDGVNLIVGTMLAIDRPLDMLRTAVNVFSDSCGAAIIAKSEGESDVDADGGPVPRDDQETSRPE